MLLLERNQTLIDLSIMLEGDLEDFYTNIMVKYNFEEATEDITNKTIDPIYNTDNNIVNNFLLQNIKIVTSENFEESDIITASFDSGYDVGYDI